VGTSSKTRRHESRDFRGRLTSQCAVASRHTARHGALRANVGAGAVKPRAHRPKLSDIRATVTVNDSVPFEVSGRTAQLIAELVLYEHRVNDAAFGELVAHFGGGKAQLELRERLPSLWLRPDLDVTR